MSNIFSDFISFIYPVTCAACGNVLFAKEKVICTPCLYHLPAAENGPDSPPSKTLWGRVDVKAITCLYRFTKKSKVQRLLHNIKYCGRQDVAIAIGNMLGNAIRNNSQHQGVIDVVVPIPMHPARQRRRGYNQAELIANGVCRGYYTPVNFRRPNTRLLQKVINITSQTAKKRFSRSMNSQNAYRLNTKEPYSYNGLHLLLIDDIITTGATLEACANQLLKIPNITISAAAIAYAE